MENLFSKDQPSRSISAVCYSEETLWVMPSPGKWFKRDSKFDNFLYFPLKREDFFWKKHALLNTLLITENGYSLPLSFLLTGYAEVKRSLLLSCSNLKRLPVKRIQLRQPQRNVNFFDVLAVSFFTVEVRYSSGEITMTELLHILSVSAIVAGIYLIDWTAT